MPLYEYRCKNCGHQFEKIQSFSAPDEKECPVCQGPLERLISPSALQFKGSGWYATDYASKGRSSSMKASADGDGKASEKSGGDKAPSKPAADSSSTSQTKSSTSKSDS
ncbi:MAG: zinc ribbon domain-containing protein [Acidobacteriaceae bacterium]